MLSLTLALFAIIGLTASQPAPGASPECQSWSSQWSADVVQVGFDNTESAVFEDLFTMYIDSVDNAVRVDGFVQTFGNEAKDYVFSDFAYYTYGVGYLYDWITNECYKYTPGQRPLPNQLPTEAVRGPDVAIGAETIQTHFFAPDGDRDYLVEFGQTGNCLPALARVYNLTQIYEVEVVFSEHFGNMQSGVNPFVFDLPVQCAEYTTFTSYPSTTLSSGTSKRRGEAPFNKNIPDSDIPIDVLKRAKLPFMAGGLDRKTLTEQVASKKN